MQIGDIYSYNEGEQFFEENHADILPEIRAIISRIDAEACRLKSPLKNERRKADRLGITHFYSPRHLNAVFDYQLHERSWDLKPRIITNDISRKGFRELDALKDAVALEVQFGKYAFLTYDIVAKLVIFRKYAQIECGIEICPMASMLPQMSSGIGAFEQVRWDLRQRGLSSLDLPVLVIGIQPDPNKNPVPPDVARQVLETQGEYLLDDGNDEMNPEDGDGDGASDTHEQMELFEESREPRFISHRISKLPTGTLKLLQEMGAGAGMNPY